MTNLKKTALNPIHHSLSAKMVDFAGWEMPVHYGSQIQEHHKVRQDAGMFDVSHMLVIDVEGPDSQNFLRATLANNIDKLQKPGKALYSCLLNPQGGVIDDLIVYYRNENSYRLVVNAGCADKDIEWLTLLSEKRNLQLQPRRDLTMLAVQGPNACAKTWQALPESKELTEALKPFESTSIDTYFIARTGYTGEDGFEIILPNEAIVDLWEKLHKTGVAPVGLGARDTLRLEAGMNLYGQDMNENTNPLESGLGWTIDRSNERDFIGKPALNARPITQQLFGLVLLDKGVLRSHQKVDTAYGIGEITSGSFSPTLNGSIALARLPIKIKIDDIVEVEIRDKKLRAKVVKYPFVRNGKVLVTL